MTVLRSREVKLVPTNKSSPISKSKTLENRVSSIEPKTPVNNRVMASKFSPDCSPPSTTQSVHITEGSESGLVRRRSLRLASKSRSHEINCNDLVLGRKIKSAVRKIDEDLKLCDTEKQGSDIEKCDTKGGQGTEVDCKGAREGEVKSDSGVVDDSFGSEMEWCSSGSGNLVKRNETPKKGKGKRKLGFEIGSVGEGDADEGCLKLRSGKKVVSHRGVRGFLQIQSDGGDKRVSGNANGGENEMEKVFNKSQENTAPSDAQGGLLVDEKAGIDRDCDPSQYTNVNGENSNESLKAGEIVEVEKVINGRLDKHPTMIELQGEVTVDEKVGTDGGNNPSACASVTGGMCSEIVAKLESSILENPNTDNVAMEGGTRVLENDSGTNFTRAKDRFRAIAKRSASRFAFFSATEEEQSHAIDEAETEMPSREVNNEPEDWPGPFSTAMKIIRDRGMSVNMQQERLSLDKEKSTQVTWVPKEDQNRRSFKFPVPRLQELCMMVLSEHVDAITSLDCVPDALKHKLSHLLCNSRKMNNHFLELLVRGSPTEICIRECSWLTEENFTKIFEGADFSNLSVLQLDQCGRCLPDYLIYATLAGSPNSMPSLTTLSLKGACRLSDVGLSSLLSSAPSLRSLNLSQCSLLTSVGINSIADSLGSVLRELYVDDCESIDPILMLPALSKLENLEVLSLAGLQTVCDDFICQLVAARGQNLKELVLADCVNLTDSSLKVISQSCTGICALDLTNLCKLTDSAIGYLANGCLFMRSLKLRRNVFSDEAIAAYLETSGGLLEELSLNNVGKVAQNTAISLSKCAKNLQRLDLSWCRNLSDEAVGLIVDSCSSLKILKLFGCTQITNVFVNGHSNEQVEVIGLQMTPILENIKVPELVGPLRYSSVSSI